MAASVSKAFSIRGEGWSAEEDSKAFSVCGKDVLAEEDSAGFSNCGEAACAEKYLEDSDLMACSVSNLKRVRAALNDRLFRGTKLDEGIWSMLDDHLLEKIIARLPFKSLFQAASLSKAWRDRFPSQAFQSEVQHSSTASSWKAYAPLFVNHKKDLVGYESGSKRWHRLPTHSYLHHEVVQDWCLRAGAGSLLCWTCAAPLTFADPNANCSNVFQVHVTNPLTKSWRQLPTRPKMHFPELVHISCEGKDYRVILATMNTQRGRACICVQIFNSTIGSWTIETYNTGKNFDADWGGSAFMDGVLFILVYTLEMRPGYKLISFDVELNIWTEIPDLSQVVDDVRNPHQPMKFYDVRFSQVFVCGSEVMLVVVHRDKVSSMDFDFDDSSDDEASSRDGSLARETLSVFELDLERGLAFELSRAPNEMLSVAGICSATGHDDCIYIGGRFPSCSSILYNVRTREWQWVSSATDSLLSFSDTRMIQWLWTSVIYQPGLNPFLEVGCIPCQCSGALRRSSKQPNPGLFQIH